MFVEGSAEINCIDCQDICFVGVLAILTINMIIAN